MNSAEAMCNPSPRRLARILRSTGEGEMSLMVRPMVWGTVYDNGVASNG